MSSARRYLLSRPRTKMYDYNYTMGERYYKPTLDQLDSRGSRNSSSAAAREAAEATAAAIFSPPPPRCRSVDEESEDGEMSALTRRIRASRAAMEEETRAREETQSSRRAAARARLDISDRLMDAVGIKSNGSSDEFSVRRPRRAISELEEDQFFKKRTFAIDDEGSASTQRWTKLESKMNGSSKAENGYDAVAASNRAKQSRARIAEIENEMEDLAEKAKARSARRAAAEAVLNEAADLDSSSSNVVSQSVRVKRTTVTEKRSAM